jgi:hypothetical protein
MVIPAKYLNDPEWLSEFECLIRAYVDTTLDISRNGALPGYPRAARIEDLARQFGWLKQRVHGAAEDRSRPAPGELIGVEYKLLRAFEWARSLVARASVDPLPTESELAAWQAILELLGHFDFEASLAAPGDSVETLSGTADPSVPPEGDRTRAPAGRDRTPRKCRTPRRRRQAAGPPVILGKFGDEPIVNGKRKARLNKPRFDVIEVLIAAGDDGLSKDSLAKESRHGDAHRILSRLGASDSDWKAVIQMAGTPGGRYRIRSASLPESPDISRSAPTKRNKG